MLLNKWLFQYFVQHFSTPVTFWSSEEGHWWTLCRMDRNSAYGGFKVFSAMALRVSFVKTEPLRDCILLQAVDQGHLLKFPFTTIFEYLQVTSIGILNMSLNSDWCGDWHFAVHLSIWRFGSLPMYNDEIIDIFCFFIMPTVHAYTVLGRTQAQKLVVEVRVSSCLDTSYT